MKQSLYYYWSTGQIGNFGSFQTYIFNAYRVADEDNMTKLENAFPEWFLNSYTGIIPR